MQKGREKVVSLISNYREAAKLARAIIPIIKKFDNKVYNKRLQTALQDATKKRIYCEKNNYYFRIYIYDDTYTQITLAHLNTKEALTDEKRIRAEKITEKLNAAYSDLLTQAYDLYNILPQVDLYKTQLEFYKTKIEQIVNSLPYEIKDNFDLNYRVRRY